MKYRISIDKKYRYFYCVCLDGYDRIYPNQIKQNEFAAIPNNRMMLSSAFFSSQFGRETWTFFLMNLTKLSAF